MSRARTDKLALGGVEYELRWDMNAVAAVEEMTGQNALLVFTLTVRTLRSAVWAAMDAAAAVRGEAAPLTPRQIGSLIGDEEDIGRTLDVMSKLIGMNLPPAPPEGEEAADPQPAATEEKPQPSAAGTPSGE